MDFSLDEKKKSDMLGGGILGAYVGGMINPIETGELKKFIQKKALEDASKTPAAYKAAMKIQEIKKAAAPMIEKTGNLISIKHPSALAKWLKLNPLAGSIGKGVLAGGLGAAGAAYIGDSLLAEDK